MEQRVPLAQLEQPAPLVRRESRGLMVRLARQVRRESRDRLV